MVSCLVRQCLILGKCLRQGLAVRNLRDTTENQVRAVRVTRVNMADAMVADQKVQVRAVRVTRADMECHRAQRVIMVNQIRAFRAPRVNMDDLNLAVFTPNGNLLGAIMANHKVTTKVANM